MGKGINIIHVNCDPSFANDSSLPRDSYLVTYGDNNEQKYDIVQGLQSDIFDEYWDKYRDFRGMKWTEKPFKRKLQRWINVWLSLSRKWTRSTKKRPPR